MVVQVLPRPRARAASMKLQTAGRTEPQAEPWTTCGRPSVRPGWQAMTWTGTSWRCSARYRADEPMRRWLRRTTGSSLGRGGAPMIPSVMYRSQPWR